MRGVGVTGRSATGAKMARRKVGDPASWRAAVERLRDAGLSERLGAGGIPGLGDPLHSRGKPQAA